MQTGMTDAWTAHPSNKLVKQREVERKRAIAEGKMDDPLVPKRLDEAITMVGTCMGMCPRFERYRRERENNLDKWEVVRRFVLISLGLLNSRRSGRVQSGTSFLAFGSLQ